MKTPNLATREQCTGCGACSAVCNNNSIFVGRERDGHYYPKINQQVCIGCLQCEKVCPICSSFEYGSNCLISKPLKAWNNNNNQRLASSSGGVFSAMAYQFIREGGYISGAVVDKLTIKHIVTCELGDISRIQGSKYLQSETVEAYKRIVELLPTTKVLFSGTGCQIAGLLCLVKKKCPNYMDNLFCVDVVCDGVPSYRLLEKTVETIQSDDVAIVSFRNKSRGWNKTPKELILKINGIDTNLGEDNLMICGFNKSLTSRFSCYDCKFAFTDRISDATIADFWGLENETEENLHKGVSLVVVHSQKGYELLKRANIQFASVDWAMATNKNFRLYQGRKPSFADTWLRKHICYMFDHFSYNTLFKFYGVSLSSRYDVVGMLIRSWYRGLNKKMKHFMKNNKIKCNGKG